MREQPRRRKEITPPEDHLDLSDTSVSEGRQEEEGLVNRLIQAEGPINLLLQAVRQEWLDAQERFEKSEDREGVELSQKVQLLCEALERLANPVSLRASQQAAVVEMLTAEAGDGSLFRFKDPGNAARAVLSIATYINSSRP